MNQNGRSRDRNDIFHIWGWILFILCAVFFIASGVRNGDMLSVIASLIFLIACFVFLIPLVRPRGR